MSIKKIFIIATAIALVLFFGSMGLISFFAEAFIDQYRHDIAGLAIEVEDVELNWLTYGVTLEKVNIYPRGKEQKRHLLASAEKIRVGLAPLDLLWKTVHVRTLTLIKPKLMYVRTSMRHTNWEALNMSWLKEEEKDKGSLGSWRLRVDKVKIKDGYFDFHDRVTRGRFELRDMKASVSNIVDEPNPKKLPSKVKVDGKLSTYDAPVRLRGRMNLLAEGLNFNFTSSIKNAPITYFAPFYAGQTPFRINAGNISVKSKMKTLKSYLNSTHNAAISNLKVGGVHGKIINPLFLKRKTIHVTAVVNGDLESGKLRVSSQVSRIIGDAILADARKAAPVQKVGEGVKKVGRKTGGALRRLFGR